MLHHLLFGQCRIIKLTLLVQIIFNSHAQVLPSTIKHRISFKNPLFFRNIIISKTTCVLKHSIKNSTMNPRQTSHAISKSICLKQFRDITRHLVSLLSICIILIMCRFCNIILFHKFTRLINRNLTLNIPSCRFLQILRRFQPIHRLQTNRHTPSLRTLTLLRFPLPNIFIKICHIHTIYTHSSISDYHFYPSKFNTKFLFYQAFPLPLSFLPLKSIPNLNIYPI